MGGWLVRSALYLTLGISLNVSPAREVHPSGEVKVDCRILRWGGGG